MHGHGEVEALARLLDDDGEEARAREAADEDAEDLEARGRRLEVELLARREEAVHGQRQPVEQVAADEVGAEERVVEALQRGDLEADEQRVVLLHLAEHRTRRLLVRSRVGPAARPAPVRPEPSNRGAVAVAASRPASACELLWRRLGQKTQPIQVLELLHRVVRGSPAPLPLRAHALVAPGLSLIHISEPTRPY